LIVLDTNIVLDLFVFDDPKAQPILEKLRGSEVQWIATAPMRDELERVLAYPQIVRRLLLRENTAAQVLSAFDARVQLHVVAPKAPVTCKDPDDQKFIDLAVVHQAQLMSKDNAILCMRKRLSALGVAVV
jgi:putative PIN family toxin of toxin-antitoxin system